MGNGSPKRKKKKVGGDPPRLSVKMSVRRKALYKKAADSKDMTMSAWAREILDRAADEQLKK